MSFRILFDKLAYAFLKGLDLAKDWHVGVSEIKVMGITLGPTQRALAEAPSDNLSNWISLLKAQLLLR